MWIVPPSLESHFVPESVCLMKPSGSLSPEPALRVTLNGKVTLKPASWRGWKRRAWSQRLFGAIRSSPSLPSSLLGELIGSALDFPASRTAWPDAERASRMNAGSGKRSPRLFTVLDRDSCFSKTSGDSFLRPLAPPSEEFCGTWPRSGSMLNGRCFELPMWAPPISAPDCSLWPTARANDSEKRGLVTPNNRAGLVGAAQFWPTEKATDGTKGGPNQAGSSGDLMLPSMAAKWQTPAADSFRSRGGDRKDEMGLDQQARHWATPTASANSNRTTRIAPSHGETHGMVLAGQAAAWPTPAARDGKGANSRDHVTGNGTGRMHLDQLPNFVAHAFSHPAPIPTCGERLSTPPHTSHRRLNPAFVCWLMGWPWWWTRTEPMPFAAREVESFRSRLRRHLRTFLEE